MKPKHRILIAHLLGSLLFLAMPIALSPHSPEQEKFFSSTMMLKEFITNCLMLAFFYLNYYLLIPRLFFQRRYPIYAACIVASFILICSVPSSFTHHDRPLPRELNPEFFNDRMPPHRGENPRFFNDDQLPPPKPRGFNFLRENMYNLHLFSIVVLFSILLKVRLRLSQSEQAHHQAEVVSLKEQINPHFLFNTLNGIYALAVRDKSSTTASALLKLSGLMRYVVTETAQVHVTLEKELAYINDYIELQKLRLDKRVQFSYEVVGSAQGKMIAPLILVPFIENAFKYGVNPDEESSIKIRIEIVYNELIMLVENNKVSIALTSFERSGKGIENTKLRLKLLYPQKHILDIADQEKQFRVHLIIQLHD